MDLVADDEPDAFVARSDIRLGRQPAFDEDGRLARDSRTGEESREVEAMPAEHPKVQSAAALVLFATDAHFLELADLTGCDELLHDIDDGVVTVAVSDGYPHALFGAQLHDLIGLGQSTHKGFLDIDSLHARFDGGDDHVAMLMDMPWADGSDVGLGLSQHDLVVGVSLHAAETLGRIRQSLGVGIGDSDDLGLRNLQPDGVLAMTEITLAGMSDDADGQGALS